MPGEGRSAEGHAVLVDSLQGGTVLVGNPLVGTAQAGNDLVGKPALAGQPRHWPKSLLWKENNLFQIAIE